MRRGYSGIRLDLLLEYLKQFVSNFTSLLKTTRFTSAVGLNVGHAR